MHPVEMDRIVTWPDEVIAFLSAHSKELRVERQQDRMYSLSPSTFRILNDAPLMPRWDEAMHLVGEFMAERELLAFHATRLIDFNHVRTNGLRMLNLEQHIERLKREFKEAGAMEALTEVDFATTKMREADRSFIRREGAVWATPFRALLHDGGCDSFYESYGGEAIWHIARCAGGKLEQAIKQLGKPAVVMIRYPAYGWCQRTEDRLPQSMIELHLQHEGNWEAKDHTWDIQITRDVPAENIVNVVHPNDPQVLA